MKRISYLLALASLSLCAHAQNWTTVSASNLTDLNQQKLAAGSMCFLGTDQNDIPISFQVGGGGQVLARPFCVPVTNGSSASLLVPNPQNTQPQGIYYRVTVTDSATGQLVLHYTQVSFSGASFNLDQYAPQYPGLVTAPGAISTPGNFTVNGNLSVTGSISGTYVFGSSAYSALSSSAAYGTFQSVSDKQRGVFVQNYPQTHWIPISPWLNLDHFAKGDAVYLNAGCSATASSYTITCSGANFTSADVGKLAVLFGARANGSGATATTTLSSGAITTPTVTAAGSGYLTRPTATVSGLTCTYNPELKVNLSGSNYATGNTLSSITVVYGGSGCTGTPSITITSGPPLALAGTIASVTNATTIVLTTNIAPSVTASSLSMLYGSDDTANINSALQALAPNTDEGLNPISVYCGRLYMTSGPINIVNKAIDLVSPGPGNLSSANAQQGCGFFLANTNYSSPTDAIYMAGAQFSSLKGIHIFSVSGNKQRAAIRLQQPGGSTTNHNNQYNRFLDNIIGPWYTGGANGSDPEANSCFTGSFTLNQCAPFQYGFFFDQPNANNDQMMFTNNMVVGADVGFYQYANQSAELLLDRYMCDGCAVGIKANANMVVRDADISNSSDCDIVLGDTTYSGTNLGIVLDLQHYTSEAGHRFLCGDAQTSAVDNISIFLHGQINWQATSSTIKSGTIIDFSGMNFGPNISLAGDQNIMPNVLGTVPATTAPLNMNWYVAGAANGPNLVQNGPDVSANVPDPPITNFKNLQLTYPDFRHSQWVKRDWTLNVGQGQRCHTDMIYFGGDPDSIECNNTTVLGKDRIFGELLVNSIGAPSSPTCSRLSGSGSTTYFYKIAGVVAGIVGPASAETSCASQAASLSSSAINQACVVPVAGAQQYAIYQSTSTGTEKLLATVAADQMVAGASNTVCYNDAVGGAAGASPLSTDSTGGAAFQGPISAQGLTLTGGSGLAVPSLNINGDGNMTKNPRIPWAAYLSSTTNNTGITFAQWTNSAPVKIVSIFAIATGAPAGCTSSIQFFVHDVAQSSNTSAATLANGAGNTSLVNPNFSVASGDTIQLQYTASGCTTQASGVNVTVEVEPQ